MHKRKSVVITGASSGLGYALTKKFASEECLVFAIARRADRLRGLVRDCPGNVVIPIVADLADKREIDSIVEEVFSKIRHLDILVNNAGVGKEARFVEMNYDDIEMMLRVNCVAAVYLTRLILPGMIRRRYGIIINISSTGGVTSLKDLAVYGATKHFLNGFTKNLHRELKGSGVRAYAFMPGSMNTEFSLVASGKESKGGESPEKIARVIYNKIASEVRRPIILPSFRSFLTVTFDGLLRGLNLR